MLKRATVLMLSVTVAGPALAANGRLPTDVVPLTYDIAVVPDAKALTFSGSETIGIEVRRATRTIVLNAAAIVVKGATFDGRPVQTALDDTAQQLTVRLPRIAAAGRHTLTFQWTGTINRSAAGLFAIDYTNADGSADRMLVTQFEAPDARRFAPMWDEPDFKAKFRLTATVPAGQSGFSNMPAASVTKTADGAQRYSFGETPLMSSYLLFLGIGDIERKTLAAGSTTLGVISRKGVSDQGDYALGAAKRLLAYYNDYFAQPYPLPKLDMIAGPGSSQFFGAMENWGAIFYFERELLFDPRIATESNRQRIHTVVAHEMAHQWFGDLVTPAWWTDLWLNEGFASWMEGKATNDLNPAWEAHAATIIDDREKAMGLDSVASTHPIVRPVETVDQISEAFDGITYSKGQAVIGMIESTLGEAPFRAGIRRYMAKYRYGNTVTDELWDELSAAAGRPITTIAHDFTLQGGVPLVALTGARCDGGMMRATLTQGRFGMDQESKAARNWHVPIVVGTLGGGETKAVVFGPSAQTVAVRGCGTLVLNKGKGSYTRVLYDDAGHAAIVRDYARLDLDDRLGTLVDDYALARGGYQDLSRWIALMNRVGERSDPLEWTAVSDELGGLARAYRGTPLAGALHAKAAAKLAPVLARIGYDSKPGESPLVTNLRETLIARLGDDGDPDVARRARAYVAALRSDPAAIPAAIRDPILATYAINATPAEWETLLSLTKQETSPVAKNRFVRLLGSARDPVLAQRALDLLETDALTDPQKASLLKSVSDDHPDLAFEWAVAHRMMAEGFVEASSRAGFVVGLGAGSADPAMPGRIRAYAARYLPASSREPADRVVAGIAVRKANAERIRPAVQAWLAP